MWAWVTSVNNWVVAIEWVVIVFFLVSNTFYLVQLLAAVAEVRRHALEVRGERRERLLESEFAPRVTLLAPAYNEEASIVENARSLLSLYYPNLDVVVVNDGSTDATLARLKEAFDLEAIHRVRRPHLSHTPVRATYRSRAHPNLVVVDKENGGKADALNAALDHATGELVCAIDADTIIEPDALQRMVRPYREEDGVVAAGGTIRVVNGCTVRHGRVVRRRVPRNFLPGVQVVEYLRAFLFGRLGFNRLGGNVVISGAFGLFDREALVGLGGYDPRTVGEDFELVMRLRRRGYETKRPAKVAFIPDPVAWTQVPATLRSLGRQRDRWHRGLAETLLAHRRVLFNPRYKAMGLVVLPYFLLIELLAPLVELVGLLGLATALAIGAFNAQLALLFFLAAYGYNLLLTAYAQALEQVSYERYDTFRDRALQFLWTLLENLGYRQLTVIWRLRGLVNFLLGRRTWGAMEREGFNA